MTDAGPTAGPVHDIIASVIHRFAGKRGSDLLWAPTDADGGEGAYSAAEDLALAIEGIADVCAAFKVQARSRADTLREAADQVQRQTGWSVVADDLRRLAADVES